MKRRGRSLTKDEVGTRRRVRSVSDRRQPHPPFGLTLPQNILHLGDDQCPASTKREMA